MVVLIFTEKLAYLTFGIVKVSEVHAVGRADRDAGWILSLLHTVNTERALVGIAVRVNEAGIVGTGGKTGFAADTFIVIDEHHAAAFVDVTGSRWAAIHAGWVGAVVAALGADFHTEIRKFPFHGGGDPIAAISFWDVIFCFACNDAIHTSYTSFGIDDHSISSHNYSPVSKVTKLTFIPVPPMMGSVLYFVTKVASDAPLPKAFFIPLALWPNP